MLSNWKKTDKDADRKKSPPAPKSSDDSSTGSVNDILNTRRKKLNDDMKTLVPTLERELKNLEQELKECSDERRFIRRRRVLKDCIEGVRKSIASITSGKKLKDFDTTVRPFILAHQRNEKKRTANPRKRKHVSPLARSKRSRRKSTQHSRRIRVTTPDREGTAGDATIVDELTNELEVNTGDCPLYVCAINTCPECNGIMRKLPTESRMACEKCGVSTLYLDSTTAAAGHGDDRSYPSFSYKKINHFKDWLRSVQAKESTTISQEVLTKVCKKMHEQRVGIKDVTPKKIREALKACKLRKYYENVVLIHSLLTGRKPPRFEPATENTLERMFLQIQSPFEKAVLEVAPERKNFLSYAYVCYKFCQLLPEVDNKWLSSFQLLKGRDKLHRQDLIWAHMCKQLNWTFYPSV